MGSPVKRINILGLPIDIVNEENLQEVIERIYNRNDCRQVILLDFHEFMKSRHDSERKEALLQAALIIPTSSLIVNAAKYLNKGSSPLYRPYSFIIRLLGILENKTKSVYLLGSDMNGVRAVESTLRSTFPGIRVVGRYAANFRKKRKMDVLTAIKKSSPTLLLTGVGLKGRHLWFSRHRQHLAGGLAIWEKTCFGVFSGRRQKPNDSKAARLITGFFNTLIRPWRILRLFRYLYFFIILLVASIRKD